VTSCADKFIVQLVDHILSRTPPADARSYVEYYDYFAEHCIVDITLPRQMGATKAAMALLDVYSNAVYIGRFKSQVVGLQRHNKLNSGRIISKDSIIRGRSLLTSDDATMMKLRGINPIIVTDDWEINKEIILQLLDYNPEIIVALNTTRYNRLDA